MQDVTPKREGQEEIDASKAPLMEHLIELRQRMIYALVSIAIGFILCFYFANQLYTLLVQPYRWATHWAIGKSEVTMIFTHPAEFFFTQLKLALFGATCLAFPNLALQLWKFVAPGLYRDEKQAFFPYLIATPILFIIATLIVYFIVTPFMMYFFIKMQVTSAELKIEMLPRVADYLSLIMTLILGFGICFQLPVALTLLARAGFLDGDNLRSFRRYAIVAIAAAAAVLSPPDPFSMLAMMLPTVLLYEGSILVVDRVVAAQKAKQAAAEAAAG
ncbi:MAG TPA: twin-arginine translocase subunit TatC [Hyphomicrobiaceae bacterium]|nr:twin-arginine translocase subunit TatC [Hyphomicrobiaceae bacterium]